MEKTKLPGSGLEVNERSVKCGVPTTEARPDPGDMPSAQTLLKIAVRSLLSRVFFCPVIISFV
jgi:hypothetical protein